MKILVIKKAYNDYIKHRISYSEVEIVLEYDDGYENRIKRGQLIEYLKNK